MIQRVNPLPPDPIPLPDLDNDEILAEMWKDLKAMEETLPDAKEFKLSFLESLWAHAYILGNSFLKDFGIDTRTVLQWLLAQIIKRQLR